MELAIALGQPSRSNNYYWAVLNRLICRPRILCPLVVITYPNLHAGIIQAHFLPGMPRLQLRNRARETRRSETQQ
jgi:hypothetical protein